jgi:tetratricopeptide (TPR) repeat protein
MTIRFVRLLAASLLAALCLAHASEPQWVEVRSQNFIVITDAGDKRGRDAALRFEQMRAAFGSLLTKAHVNLSVPLQIVAFRNSKEMRQFAPLFNGKPTEMAGLFMGGQDRTFILLDMSVENPWTVVFHEYAHRLMDGNLNIHTDPWFEEGFAEYFASIEVDGKQARIGKIPDQTYLILQQNSMMKIADLFRVQQNTKTYNESGDHRTVFYVQSGLVMHYIFDNQLMLKAGQYFEFVHSSNVAVEDAIHRAFGMSSVQFDKELRNYLGSGRYKYYALPAPKGLDAATFSVTPVATLDAQVLLADLHLHSVDYQEKAVAEYEATLKTDPNHAGALRGIGYAYLQKRDMERARSYFQRASRQASKDPFVHYYTAMLINRTEDATSTPEQRAEIEKELEATIALDPDFADAYSMLSFAQMSGGDLAKALTTMKKAVELSPRNDSYLYNLASLYMANRKTDDAIPIFESLTRSSEPAIAAQAATALAQARQFKAYSANAGTTEPMLIVRNPSPADEAAPPAPPPVSAGAAHFLKGKIVHADCETSPAALLTVMSGGKEWKLRVRDRQHVILIGADEFSCDWANQAVAINFRDGKDGYGDVISLELQ